MATNYKEVHGKLRDFLDQYQKIAEDPERKAVSEEEMTDNDNVERNPKQGEAGKEMAEEIKNNDVRTGNSVEDGKKNTGNAPAPEDEDGHPKDKPKFVETTPEEALSTMKNVDPALKKAYAQQYVLENSVMDVIDRYFTQKTAATAEDLETEEAANIIAAAEAYKTAHVKGLSEAYGINPKVANDILNQVADENPGAILPAEALSDEDAEAILAEAAALDAEEAGAVAPDEAVATEDIAAALEPIVGQMIEEGYSEDEIAAAILEEADITEEDIVEMAISELGNQGYTEEEAGDILEALGQLQEDGASPEELAELLGSLG